MVAPGNFRVTWPHLILLRMANPFPYRSWGSLDPESIIAVGLSVTAARLISPVGSAVALLAYVLIRLTLARMLARAVLARRGFLIDDDGVMRRPPIGDLRSQEAGDT